MATPEQNWTGRGLHSVVRSRSNQADYDHSPSEAARIGETRSLWGKSSNAMSIGRGTLSIRTEVGETYLEHCQRVMEEVEQADLAVGALLAKPRGRLRIAAPVAFARAILGPILKEFLFMYPELRLHLQLLNGDSIPREGSFDILIRPGPLEDSGLLVKPLMRIQLGVFASPGYLTNREPPSSPLDLRDHDCITTGCGAFGEPADSATWRLRRGTETREIRVDSRVSVPDPMLNHQLAIAGVGAPGIQRVLPLNKRACF
jgi:DNA-binding transcriptional LysR family regulator